MSLALSNIIKRPIALTEKASRIKADNNPVVFEVDRGANKIQIRSAVEALFGVKVVSVNTIKNHKKRLYLKLDITTERELFLNFVSFLFQDA